MQILTETPEAITITHIHPKWFRLLLGGLALFPLFGFYEMLLKPRWNWSAFTIDNPAAFAMAAIPVIIGLGCMSMTIALIGGALFGPDIVYMFDKKRRILIYTESKRPFRNALKLEVPFAALPAIDIVENTDTDGPSHWQLTLRLAHQKSPHTLYYYTGEKEALTLRDRLTAVT